MVRHRCGSACRPRCGQDKSSTFPTRHPTVVSTIGWRTDTWEMPHERPASLRTRSAWLRALWNRPARASRRWSSSGQAQGCAAAAAIAERGASVILLEESRHWNPPTSRQTPPSPSRTSTSTRRRACEATPSCRFPAVVAWADHPHQLRHLFPVSDVVLDEWREEHGCSTVSVQSTTIWIVSGPRSPSR